MTDTDDAAPACLNCGAPLSGPFCAKCGQRAVPPYPTLREYAGDAWEEMSGWDGRFARSLKTLLRRPGVLTVETLRGKRATYIKPLRLYLSASVVYFLLAANAPITEREVGAPGGGPRIKIMGEEMSDEARAKALERFSRAPGVLSPMFVNLIEDPAGFRSRVLAAFPKMIFALVPAFALILGVFYRGRRYMQHLTFALHANAAIFLALIPAQLARMARIEVAAAIAGAVAVIVIVWYAFRAQRVVYGDGRLLTLAKSAGIVALYSFVAIPALFLLIAWAAYFR
jgi:hypothetical protein